MNSVTSIQSSLPQNLINLLQLMQEGLIVLDASGTIVFAYQTAGKLIGVVDHNDLIGKHFSELY